MAGLAGWAAGAGCGDGGWICAKAGFAPANVTIALAARRKSTPASQVPEFLAMFSPFASPTADFQPVSAGVVRAQYPIQPLQSLLSVRSITFFTTHTVYPDVRRGCVVRRKGIDTN
jgi:hypothetical protein